MQNKDSADIFRDLPDRQRAIVVRMAKAWAAEEDEGDMFDSQRPVRPGDAGGDVFRSYASDVTTLMTNAGILDLLSFADILSRNPPKDLGPQRTLDEVEAYIAGKMVDISRIRDQIAQWESDPSSRRDESWARAATLAVEAKERSLRAAHSLRLKIMRRNDFEAVIAGRDKQIADLVASGKAVKERHMLRADRERAAVDALMRLIAERAPELEAAALEARDAAQSLTEEAASKAA